MTKNRDAGLDLLKIIAMFFICVHHILYHGENIINDAARLVNVVVYNGLYIFPLVTGYVSYKANFKTKRIIELWLQTVFYTATFTLLFWLISKGQIWEGGYVALTPLKHKTYWYLNCHLKLLLVMPFINYGLRFVKKKMVMIGLLIVVLVTLVIKDPILYDNIYVFVLIYLAGAIIAKLQIKKTFTTRLLFAVLYIINISLVCKDLFNGRYFVALNLVAATSALLLFAELSFKKMNITICNVASLTFGVYLIHDNPLVRHYFIKSTGFIGTHEDVTFFLILILVSVFVFVFCLCIEFLRSEMFNKLKINKTVGIVSNRIDLIINNGILQNK